MEIIVKLCNEHGIEGWRKSNGWVNNLKGLLRTLGRANQGGGIDKKERVKKAAKNYINKAKELANKIDKTLEILKKFKELDKIFSVFEQYTQWINKGKAGNKIELGLKLLITTEQHGLIIDYKIMEQTADNKEIIDLAKRVQERFNGNIASLSMDKRVEY